MVEHRSVDQVLSDLSRHDEHEPGLKLVKLLCSKNRNVLMIFYVVSRCSGPVNQAVEEAVIAVINHPAALLDALRAVLADKVASPMRQQRATRQLL